MADRVVEVDLFWLADMRHLVDLEPRGLVPAASELADLVAALPLRRLKYTPIHPGEEACLRRRLPDADVRAWQVYGARPCGSIRSLGEEQNRYSVALDLASRWDVGNNYDAEERLMGLIAAHDPGLANRLEWDTEADAVWIRATEQVDLERVLATSSTTLQVALHRSEAALCLHIASD